MKNRFLLLAIALLTLLCCALAHAEADASGTWGACKWDVVGDTLTVHAGTASGEAPWKGTVACWTDKQDIRIRFDGRVVVNEPAELFSLSSWDGDYRIIELDVTGIDISSATSMEGMFSNLHLDTIKGLDTLDTSNVTNMSRVFQDVNGNVDDRDYEERSDIPGIALNISKWDTSNVVDMSYMFEDAIIDHFDPSNWNTTNVTNMECMFGGAYIPSLDLSKWNTSKVTNMFEMFTFSHIQDLDLSSWDLQSIESIEDIFGKCHIGFLNLNGWDTRHLIDQDMDLFYAWSADQLKVGKDFYFCEHYCLEEDFLYSTRDQRLYSETAIVENRNGIADTYYAVSWDDDENYTLGGYPLEHFGILELPSGLTRLESKALINTDALFILLPDSLEYIANDAASKGKCIVTNDWNSDRFHWCVSNDYAYLSGLEYLD